ncbi:MAG: XdhC family protein [Acidobacteriota bacterium]|nr:XdhC family protein [Acidobacteriota bacterium]
MNKELKIWQFAAERLKQNESLMLLVVAESSGSSPGRQGFKMIVAENDLIGSIGGGVMEVRLVETAKRKMESGKWKVDSEIVEQIHRKNSPSSSGMICSGKQKIIFKQLTKDDLRTVQKIIRYLVNARNRYLRVTHIELSITAKKIPPFDFKFEQKNSNEFLYEEKLGFKNKLSIVGGGHCALALSELISKMDFYISLFDDRPNLNTLDKNKFVHAKTVIESYAQIDEFIPSGANHFVVVMTLGYKTDELVIRKLIGKDFKYFGVMGSRSKMKTLLRNLEKEGFDRGKLNQIRTPIGLEINSQTPEEIAVSIAAEIIAVKNA